MKVTIIIPTLNEEESIGQVIRGFKNLGFTDVLVIDGNSVDKTREIAKKEGANVVVQSGKGKGQAIMEAFQIVESDVVIVVDGDGSYDPSDALKLLEPIERGIAEHVTGNRFANFEKGAFTKLNLIGNKILNFAFRILYGVELHDILTGYRALKKEVYKSVKIEKRGFEVEAELTVESLAKGFKIFEIPITYKKRVGKTKLSPLKDGLRIGLTIYSLLRKYSPGRYFYFIGFFLIILGVISGAITVRDWFYGISHYLLAILTALFIMSGLQIIILGFLSDVLYKSNLMLRREIEKINRRIEDEVERN